MKNLLLLALFVLGAPAAAQVPYHRWDVEQMYLDKEWFVIEYRSRDTLAIAYEFRIAERFVSAYIRVGNKCYFDDDTGTSLVSCAIFDQRHALFEKIKLSDRARKQKSST